MLFLVLVVCVVLYVQYNAEIVTVCVLLLFSLSLSVSLCLSLSQYLIGVNCVGSMLNLFLSVTLSLLNLSSGEKRAG